MGRPFANVCSHLILGFFHSESHGLNTSKSFLELDDFLGVDGIAQEDVVRPRPVHGEQLPGLLLLEYSEQRPDPGPGAAVATLAVQPMNSRKWDVCKVTS